MLPGVGIEAGDFARKGLVAAVQERGLPVDVAAVRPALGHYLDGTIDKEIQREVIRPAQQAGYTRIWFLAISLGGMGALLYAGSEAADVEGVILLAPFLGTQGTLAEIVDAGGLMAWSSGASQATAAERRLLIWLKDFLLQRRKRPALYLGYGRADRFARGHAMLADLLPNDRVVVAAGGHDWETWTALWRQVLDMQPFAGHADPDAPDAGRSV
jgi:alpha-beta hydrolase superfamily lysophospholipase